MDGMHDLGGKQGFGEVRYTLNAPAFHAAWEVRANSLYAFAVRCRVFNMDEYRYAIERMAEILAVAYGHALNLRPKDPEWEGRDRFLLSHGHYAIAFYAALIEAGIVPEEELETYGGDDSRLPMSGMATYTPGMEMSGGSLGQGLPIAVGMALGLRQKGNSAFVYNCMSDFSVRADHVDVEQIMKPEVEPGSTNA